MAPDFNRGRQSGFTLVEVMIVVAIIGIIAMVAMPEVRGYQARAKVSEAMLMITNCRNQIQEIYLSGNDLPIAGEWGCEAEQPSKYVERINTKPGGIVVVTLSNAVGDGRLAIHDITLTPLNRSGSRHGRQRCRRAGPAVALRQPDRRHRRPAQPAALRLPRLSSSLLAVPVEICSPVQNSTSFVRADVLERAR